MALNDEPRIAAGYDRLAIDLEQHIKYYTPEGWIVPVSNVAHTPMFSAEEAKVFMEAHRESSLKTRLEELSQNKDFPFNQLKPFYVKDAIKDFFEKKIYEPYEGDL